MRGAIPPGTFALSDLEPLPLLEDVAVAVAVARGMEGGEGSRAHAPACNAPIVASACVPRAAGTESTLTGNAMAPTVDGMPGNCSLTVGGAFLLTVVTLGASAPASYPGHAASCMARILDARSALADDISLNLLYAVVAAQ